MTDRPASEVDPVPDAGADDEGEHVDGRTARRDRNRVAVLDAALELFGEGHLVPTAHQVAARSGVSLRSVYRYFEDREGLLRAAIDHHWARIAPLLELDAPGQGPRRERVDRIVASRLALYEVIAPIARVAVVRAVSNEVVGKLMEERRFRLSRQVDAQFAPELDAMAPAERQAVAAALDLLLSVEGIEYLGAQRGLRGDALARALRGAVTALLS